MTIYNMDDKLRRASYYIFVKCKYKLIKTPQQSSFYRRYGMDPFKNSSSLCEDHESVP